MYYSILLVNVGDNPDRPRPGRLWLRNLYRVHQRLCMAFPSASRQAQDPDFLQPYRPEDFGTGQVHVTRAGHAGFLFRIDPLPAGRAAILVQSASMPNWEYAFRNADYLLTAPPYEWQNEPRFEAGQRLRFRLLANATKKVETTCKADRCAEPACTCQRAERAAQAGLASLPHADTCPVRAYRKQVRAHGRRRPLASEELVAWLAQRAPSAGFAFDAENLVLQPGYAYARLPAPRPGQKEISIRFRAVRYDGILTVTDPDRLRQAVASGIGPAKGFGFGLLSLSSVRSENIEVMQLCWDRGGSDGSLPDRSAP